MYRMKSFFQTCHSLCEKCIVYLSTVPLLLLSILTLVYQNHISFDIIETSTIGRNGLRFALSVVVAVILLYLLYRLLRFIPESALFAGFALLYLIGGIYLITHIRMSLRYDSGICYWNALNFCEGNFTNLQFGEYFYKNPHQLGLVSYNCLHILISDDPNLIYYTNLIWILLTNFFLWQTARLVFSDAPATRKLIIVLTFCFLPQFFYLFYAYGQVPGMGCLAIALYLTVKALQRERIRYMLISLIFIGIACLVRQNYLIGGIALILLYLLNTLKKQRIFYPIAILCLLLAMIVPGRLLHSFYENAADTSLDSGMPSSLYIAMGLQENEAPWRAAGWYNGFNDTTYRTNNCDPDQASQAAMEAIKDRILTFIDDPAYALDFFGEKIITTWCEPTYQSIWSGPMISMGNTSEVPWLNNLYSGGSVFQLLASGMNALTVILFVFALLNVLGKTFLLKESLNSLEMFCLLFFMGGFVFHFFWETKSQYVYPYIIALIPLAGNGISTIFKNISQKIPKNH